MEFDGFVPENETAVLKRLSRCVGVPSIFEMRFLRGQCFVFSYKAAQTR